MNERIESLLREHLSSVDRAPVMGADMMASAAAHVGRRLRRRRRAGVAIASAGLVAVGAMAVWSTPDRSAKLIVSRDGSTAVAATTTDTVVTTTTATPASPWASAWAPIAPDPRGVAFAPYVVWTGREAISVGGRDDKNQLRAGASAYDPARNSWRTLADPPVNWERTNALVEWTGTEMLLIGGQTPDGFVPVSSGLAYDPATDTWRTFLTPPSGFISDRSPAAWTGTDLLVWPSDGGDSSIVITPFAYNPTSDSWRTLPEPPLKRRGQSASVWTGAEWIVWGGSTGQDEFNDGTAYNPGTNTWRLIADSPLSNRRVRAAWTGTEMIVASGSAGGDRQTNYGEMAVSDGAAYNPVTDTWRPIADGFAHPGFAPVWTGNQMIMFAKNGAAIYSVASNSWIDACCDETSASSDTPLWTGTVALLIGSSDQTTGGATFTPPPTTTPETTAAATTAPTITTVPSGVSILAIPESGGDVVAPTVIGTIQYGAGAGQISLQNGEFNIGMAVFADSLLIPEDVPFSGLSGKGVVLNRDGVSRRDVTIDGVYGATPLWISGSPNGTLFIAMGRSTQPSVLPRLTAYRASGGTFTAVRSVDFTGGALTAFSVSAAGIEQDGQLVMAIDTGTTNARVELTNGQHGPAKKASATLTRTDTHTTWQVDRPPVLDPNALTETGRAGVLNDGAWYRGTSSTNTDGAFIALLTPLGPNRFYRLGNEWQLAGFDANQLFFVRTTTQGLDIGVLADLAPSN